jgi:hypothetical protein
MDNDGNYRSGPRLFSFDGRREANILDWIALDPVSGLVSVTYAPAYERLRRAGSVRFADPRFVAVVRRADPVAMRNWIVEARTRLDEEVGTEHPRDRTERRAQKSCP